MHLFFKYLNNFFKWDTHAGQHQLQPNQRHLGPGHKREEGSRRQNIKEHFIYFHTFVFCVQFVPYLISWNPRSPAAPHQHELHRLSENPDDAKKEKDEAEQCSGDRATGQNIFSNLRQMFSGHFYLVLFTVPSKGRQICTLSQIPMISF